MGREAPEKFLMLPIDVTWDRDVSAQNAENNWRLLTGAKCLKIFFQKGLDSNPPNFHKTLNPLNITRVGLGDKLLYLVYKKIAHSILFFY